MTRVLVIDDEPQLRRTLNINFRERGYEVDLAETGERGVEAAARHHPDAIIVDLGLPGIEGVEVIKRVRAYSDVPIVVLSVRDTESTKVAALDAGADDYVTKPFGIDELLARLRAVLRRTTPEEEERIETIDFVIDLTNKSVTKQPSGEVVKMTPIEWSLLEIFGRNPGKLMTHRQLLESVWGPNHTEDANYLRVYMTQLRRKLEANPSRPQYFLTETGMGYRFRAE